jgi:hypothetical protein
MLMSYGCQLGYHVQICCRRGGVAASLPVQNSTGRVEPDVVGLCAWLVDMLPGMLMLTQKGWGHGLGLGGVRVAGSVSSSSTLAVGSSCFYSYSFCPCTSGVLACHCYAVIHLGWLHALPLYRSGDMLSPWYYVHGVRLVCVRPFVCLFAWLVGAAVSCSSTASIMPPSSKLNGRTHCLARFVAVP